MRLRLLLLGWFAFLLSLPGQELVPGRYIVELEGPPAARHARPERRRVEIRDQHQAAERWLRAQRARVVASVDTVLNAVVVEAPDAAALRRLPGVRRVTPVRAYELFLNRALANHKAPAAWDLAGGVGEAGKDVKIAILDTGIDPRHPGFRPPEDWRMPEGYPRVSAPEEDNLALTNPKIVVARSFDGSSARDREGHGTAVAMVAAGVRHESPRGVISGIAPAARLGVYRVSNLRDGLIYSDIVLQALDWAVKDGMDVVNMSFGSVGAYSSEDDPLAEGVRNAVEAGLIVVNAAGNTSGPMTVDDTAGSEKVIGVGSNNSTPADVTRVIPSRGAPMPAAASSNVTSLAPVMAPLADAARLGDPLGCRSFPPDSLQGRIPLIERGVCNFHVKLANAAAAGAPAAIVFNSANPPNGDPESLVVMNVDDNPTIPGLFIRRSDGLLLKDLAAAFEDFQVTLQFPNPDAAPDQISSFSSRGPSVDLRIKPDLLATGSPVYTAAVLDERSACDICDPSGYASLSGTSFSAPLVAGAAAVLKSARPGLDGDAYRSLLINSAQPFVLSSGSIAPVQSAGAGMLNLKNAVTSMVAASPVSLSFGAGKGDIDKSLPLLLRNLSGKPVTLAVGIESRDEARPQVEPAEVALEPGQSAELKVAFAAGGLAPGAYQGFVKIRRVEKPAGENNGDGETGPEGTTATAGRAGGRLSVTGENGEGEGGGEGEDEEPPPGEQDPQAAMPEVRVPYWYAVEGGGPDAMVVLRQSPREAKRSSTVRIYLRFHDSAGLPLSKLAPRAAPVSGGGIVSGLRFAGEVYPNSWLVEIRTGPIAGPNVFQVEVDGRIFYFQVVTSN